jgi:hypothetical protein
MRCTGERALPGTVDKRCGAVHGARVTDELSNFRSQGKQEFRQGIFVGIKGRGRFAQGFESGEILGLSRRMAPRVQQQSEKDEQQPGRLQKGLAQFPRFRLFVAEGDEGGRYDQKVKEETGRAENADPDAVRQQRQRYGDADGGGETQRQYRRAERAPLANKKNEFQCQNEHDCRPGDAPAGKGNAG